MSGWFVLNVADAPWLRHERAGRFALLEPPDDRFADFGINVHVLEPGQPNGKYHSESVQEDFLVLHGECVLIVEGEERRLKAWDFVHCAAGARHIFVGAGDGPCAILMVGARRPDATIEYPVDEVAARYGASVIETTGEPAKAYADWPGQFEPVPPHWPLA